MALTSSLFLTFLVLLLFIYYIFPKKLQWILLLIASLIFIVFSTSNVSVYIYLLLAVFISYVGANLIGFVKTRKNKKIIQFITVTVLVLQLIILKYINLIGTTSVGIANLLKINFNWKDVSIVVPLGISFYTLIAIGYVIDAGREKVLPQKNILKHILFVLYFPQLTSGPFTRYSEMEKELYTTHEFDFKNISFGFQRILWGFFKKLVISERLAVIANAIFNNYTQYSGINIIIGAVAFTLQLYTDFSGCMDIVLGASKTLGVSLPENFDTPLFSKSIPEFWRRWHITLGAWFREYLYFPLGGSKKGNLRTYINLMIIFLVSGIWHGTSWTFLVWGALNGIYSVIDRIINKKISPKLNFNRENVFYKFWQIISTFALTCFAFIFFRAETIMQAVNMIKSIATFSFANIGNYGLAKIDFVILCVSILLLFIVSVVKQKNNIREIISRKPIYLRYAIWICLIMIIIVFGYYGIGYDATSFLYQKF